jgi:hypothetical protein
MRSPDRAKRASGDILSQALQKCYKTKNPMYFYTGFFLSRRSKADDGRRPAAALRRRRRLRDAQLLQLLSEERSLELQNPGEVSGPTFIEQSEHRETY